MKITDPSAELVAAARGELAALDRLLVALQPGIHNLAVRMLGQRDDAADATQEILLKVVTHLGSFRGEAAFSTWVWRIARNHLLTAHTRRAESPEVSLDALAERLQAGLDFTSQLHRMQGGPMPLTPEDKLEAHQIALGCTQGMLMALDREQRLAYLIDTVFDLSSKEAAQVLEISAEAYRQRVSRARARLDAFAESTCGLVNPQAGCRCTQQLPALRHQRAAGGPSRAPMALHRAELAEAERNFAAFTRVSEAAALFRAHPDYQAPQALLGAIRAVLRHEGFMDRGGLQ